MSTKAALYLRLSKEDLNKENQYSESIENQQLLLLKYACDNDFEIEDIYIDDDFSGLDSARPQFNRMIENAQQKKFSVILCKNQSRFSRDVQIIEKYLHNLFILWGIRFIGVVDNIDTGIQGGKKSRQINSLVNEWYCEDISENVRAALRAKKNQGQYLGHWCPYGYKLSPENKHQLVIDSNTSSVVKKIFHMTLKGYSPYETAGELTAAQIDTPTFYKLKNGVNYYNPSFSGKNIWSQNTVRKILKDQTYIGHLVQGRQKKISYKINKVVDVPESQWIICENSHEPIIDKTIYFEVQKQLEKRSVERKRKSHKTPLSGIFFCRQCKNKLKIHYNSGNTYLRCENKDCSFKSINQTHVLQQTENEISKLIQIKNTAFSKALHVYQGEKEAQACSGKNTLNAQMASCKTSLSNAYIDYSTGNISYSSYKIISENLEKRIHDYEQKLKELQMTEIKNTPISIPNNFNWDFGLNKYIISELIEKIEIGRKDEKTFEICFFWQF